MIASDGFTYERRSIETWFQIRGSSPSTGLELSNTTLKHNGALADKIKKWIAGEPFNELQFDAPKRRRRTHSTVDLYIEIHFVGTLSSFSRKIPLSLSVENLYRVAFQGMKGRHFNFDLSHNGNVLHASLDSIQKRGLADKSTIYVDLTESHKSGVFGKGKSTRKKSESEPGELVLVKVYHDHDDHLFSFWIPRHTKQSLTSIIFRFWRYDAEYQFQMEDYDVEVWTNIVKVGDGHSVGNRWEHWETLRSLFKPSYATGILDNEEFLEREPTQGVETLVASNSSDEKYVVLKILLQGYKPRIDAKRAKIFSRVRP